MLKDLGIRGRVLMLTLLPSTLLAVVLGAYFTWMQLSEMRHQLDERGQLIAEQLAPQRFGSCRGGTVGERDHVGHGSR